jgi:hypothetical protein
VVTDRDEVVDALKGGVLRGREVRELSTEWGEVFAIDIAAAELREAWSEARTRLPETGRWPVAVTAWNGRVEDEIFSRWLYGEGDNSPAAICERASALTLEDALARPHLLNAELYYAVEWERVVELELEYTRRRLGFAPAEDEVLSLDLRPDHVALERWLLDWEEAREPTVAPAPGGHLKWFEPDNCALVLLPTAASEETPAYISFYGAEGEGGHERLIALLRSWRERFAAEIVACWGTMLELRVTAPPSSSTKPLNSPLSTGSLLLRRWGFPVSASATTRGRSSRALNGSSTTAHRA